MNLKLHNTLSKQLTDFQPLNQQATIYSCGPTVYDRVHIGNLSAFIAADTLRRVIALDGYAVKHVMNLTDIDDKTITRSQSAYPDMAPPQALEVLTSHYSQLFMEDMQAIGNDIDNFDFLNAADPATIAAIQQLINQLYHDGFAYAADDGVYFDIGTYRQSGKKYGQLVELTADNTAQARISNDEYDKESIHDFALWKKQKPGEPAWPFELDGHDLTGRPGWHIECSAMSRLGLGQPFDIHTGGIDLAFPHHENEIAQSTAGKTDPTYARLFMHNEHILVDGRKMSKSLNNFYTLDDIIKQHYEPLAFRMLVLQSHYRRPTNFSFTNLAASQNRLNNWRSLAELRHQINDTVIDDEAKAATNTSLELRHAKQAILKALNDDLNLPQALSIVDEQIDRIKAAPTAVQQDVLVDFLEFVDSFSGLQLIESTPDIDEETKQLIIERQRAREAKDFKRADKLRDQLKTAGLSLLDSATGQYWTRY